jgi:hypothetical protein
MGDLDIGWAVPTEFPETGWTRESVDQHLAQALVSRDSVCVSLSCY